MIADISEIGPDATLFADVCVVGSGAAGITIAREFIGTSYSVIVLEGGGRSFESLSQEPYRSEVVGLSHSGIHRGRARVLGGTTTLWVGQALPLLDIDFQKREFVPHFSQFTRIPNFAHKYRADLQAASNVTVLTHANVVRLEATREAAALREVQVRSFQNRRARVRARMFVICCGGIETPRLLLVSDSVEPHGIGNRHDVVGRFFQDHPGVSLPVRPRDPKRFSKWYGMFRKAGIRFRQMMVASERLQRKHRILHTGAGIYYPLSEDDPVVAAKEVLKALRDPQHKLYKVSRALPLLTRRPGKVAAAAFRYYVLRQSASDGSTQPYLGIGGEQEPNPDSRVTLSRATDSLGMRRTVLDWRMTGAQVQSIQVFLQAIAEEWQRLDIADIDPTQLELHGREHGDLGGFGDFFHHMGTTRMGTNPKTSVVDASCRVHGYDNLYIGSSSVFPTSGFSNPTLTIIALCIRISDEIKTRLPRSAKAGAQPNTIPRRSHRV
jgi:choline dehydrogenase-like flavoprotein